MILNFDEGDSSPASGMTEESLMKLVSAQTAEEKRN